MKNRLERIRPEEIRKIVLNGGGVKGGAHVTAYAALLACGVDPKNIDAIVGTSVGSMLAVLIAVGYSIDEMHQAMTNLDFLDFLDEDGVNTRKKVVKTVDKLQAGKPAFFAVKPVLSKSTTLKTRIAKNSGIYRGENLRLWLEEKIYAKTGIEYCTFGELRALASKNPQYKALFVIVTNDNTKLAELLGRPDSDNVIISDASRASAALPGFFETHQLYQKVDGKRVLLNNDVYSDGGIHDNYAIDCFDAQPNGDILFNREVIGLYLCSSPVSNYLLDKGPLPKEEMSKGFSRFVKTIGKIAVDTQYSDFINSEKDKARTIPIDNKGVSTIDFNLQSNPLSYNALLESGWGSTCEYFGQQHDFPEKFKIHVASPELH